MRAAQEFGPQRIPRHRNRISSISMHMCNNIHQVDLDTIDLSNLNRQFLFQRRHIGLSKAQVTHMDTYHVTMSQVARESALRFDPSANIVAHHANIKSSEFGPDFFRKFTLVMNALDNLGVYLIVEWITEGISACRRKEARESVVHGHR